MFIICDNQHTGFYRLALSLFVPELVGGVGNRPLPVGRGCKKAPVGRGLKISNRKPRKQTTFGRTDLYNRNAVHVRVFYGYV